MDYIPLLNIKVDSTAINEKEKKENIACNSLELRDQKPGMGHSPIQAKHPWRLSPYLK